MPPANNPNTDPNDVSLKTKIRNFISTLLIFIAAPLVALILTAFVFQSYEVDGPSMEHTLQNADRLIVLKTSRSWSRLTKKPYIPGRGEIVIFNRPGNIETGDKQKQLIKRVVALPGEHILIKDGTVTVFSESKPEGFQPDLDSEFSKVIHTTAGNTIDQIVPKDEVFVLGDNRSNSQDSRYFGTVPVKDVVGELWFRIYPFNKINKF